MTDQFAGEELRPVPLDFHLLLPELSRTAEWPLRQIHETHQVVGTRKNMPIKKKAMTAKNTA